MIGCLVHSDPLQPFAPAALIGLLGLGGVAALPTELPRSRRRDLCGVALITLAFVLHRASLQRWRSLADWWDFNLVGVAHRFDPAVVEQVVQVLLIPGALLLAGCAVAWPRRDPGLEPAGGRAPSTPSED